MSLVLIRQALEVHLNSIDPKPTGWENEKFDKPDNGPYRMAWLMPAEPINEEISASYQEHGLFQVNLYYPSGDGSADAVTEAELIRAAFPRRATFTRGGLSVIVENTPYIAPAMSDNDRYVIPIRIPFRSFITS